MFDLKLIRETPDLFDSGWRRRGMPPQTSTILHMDETHRAELTNLEAFKAKMNDVSKQIGQRKAKKENADDLMAEAAKYKDIIAGLEGKAKNAGDRVKDFLAHLPNIPDDSVPVGADEKGNVEVRKHGEPARLNNAKEHFDIGEALGGIDFETAAKMSGSRFVLLRAGVARLERALAQFMLDTHTQEHGYTEVSAPLLVNKDAMYGTGQLPKFEEDLFKIAPSAAQIKFAIEEMTRDPGLGHKLLQDASYVSVFQDGLGRLILDEQKQKYLVPTSEVSLTNTVMDSIVDAADLPLRLTALSPCFRSEAGAAGRDTRGMIRQHQFYKVELVSIVDPDKSAEEHERMTNCAENILKKLGLAYRTVVLCTGDMGFSARKTYDIEVWLPGQNAYREISSCSNCGDFQARRMMARCKTMGEKTRYVHTLNGSGLAVGRALIAVLENYQQMDGSVIIPDVLKPYMGGLTKLEPIAKKGAASA